LVFRLRCAPAAALSHRHIWPKGPTWIGGSIGATVFRAMASVLWGGLVLGASGG